MRLSGLSQRTGRRADGGRGSAQRPGRGAGRTLLYWWPDDGWQRGTVARLCPRGAFSHVVDYPRLTLVLRGTADTLLDAASYADLRHPLGASLSSLCRRGDPGPSP